MVRNSVTLLNDKLKKQEVPKLGNGNVSMIVLLVIFVAFMYFGMIRPQKKQQQKRQEMLSQLKKGDPIVTIGGLHGVIDSIDQQAGTVVIDSDGIYLTFNLNAVRGVAHVRQPQPRLQQQKPKPPTQMNSVWLRKHLILRPSPMINRLLLTAMPKQTMTSRLKVKG